MTGESSNILRGPLCSPLLQYKSSDKTDRFTELSFIRAKSIPHGGGGFVTTVKARIETGRDETGERKIKFELIKID